MNRIVPSSGNSQTTLERLPSISATSPSINPPSSGNQAEGTTPSSYQACRATATPSSSATTNSGGPCTDTGSSASGATSTNTSASSLFSERRQRQLFRVIPPPPRTDEQISFLMARQRASSPLQASRPRRKSVIVRNEERTTAIANRWHSMTTEEQSQYVMTSDLRNKIWAITDSAENIKDVCQNSEIAPKKRHDLWPFAFSEDGRLYQEWRAVIKPSELRYGYDAKETQRVSSMHRERYDRNNILSTTEMATLTRGPRPDREEYTGRLNSSDEGEEHFQNRASNEVIKRISALEHQVTQLALRPAQNSNQDSSTERRLTGAQRPVTMSSSSSHVHSGIQKPAQSPGGSCQGILDYAFDFFGHDPSPVRAGHNKRDQGRAHKRRHKRRCMTEPPRRVSHSSAENSCDDEEASRQVASSGLPRVGASGPSKSIAAVSSPPIARDSGSTHPFTLPLHWGQSVNPKVNPTNSMAVEALSGSLAMPKARTRTTFLDVGSSRDFVESASLVPARVGPPRRFIVPPGMNPKTGEFDRPGLSEKARGKLPVPLHAMERESRECTTGPASSLNATFSVQNEQTPHMKSRADACTASSGRRGGENASHPATTLHPRDVSEQQKTSKDQHRPFGPRHAGPSSSSQNSNHPQGRNNRRRNSLVRRRAAFAVELEQSHKNQITDMKRDNERRMQDLCAKLARAREDLYRL